MLKKIFQTRVNNIATAALLVAFSSLASRFLGVLRDRILAGQFGAGDTLDVYYAAFRIPDMIFNLLVLGALSAGFIPVFTKLIKNEDAVDGNHEAWLLANNVFNTLGLALVVISTIAILGANYITAWFAPGFSPEKLALTASLSRIMFLSPLLLGLSSIVGGMLQSFRHFLIYSLSPILYNLGIIFGAYYFVPQWGIIGLAWGVVVGALMHLLIQLPSLFGLGFRYKFVVNLRDKNLRQIGRMMVPRTMSLAIAQVDLVISTAIASLLMAGSLAIFNFANNLQTFPIGIFGISFATAVFPMLSKNAHDKDITIKLFSKTFKQIMFFMIPSTVLLLTLRAEIIRVVLGSGQFNQQAILLTYSTLGFFIISLFAQGTIPLLVRVFYARQNSKTPFKIGIISVLFDISLAYIFSRFMGVSGIALAFSIANIINFSLLWLALRFELGSLGEKAMISSLGKVLIAGALLYIFIILLKLSILGFVVLNTTLSILLFGIFVGTTGLLAYLIVCVLLKNEEALGLLNRLGTRLNWSVLKNTDQSEARGI